MPIVDFVVVNGGVNQTDDVKVTLDGESLVVSSSALPTGASTAANQATIIGHVDGIETLLGTIDSDTSTILTNTNFGAVVGGGTEATALRVTLANDSTGVLSIDDNGSSITVDGSVTVSGSLTSAGNVTNAGTFAVQAAQSGTWNIGTVTTVTTLTSITNAVSVVGGVAHDAADSGNPIKIGGKAVATPSTATMVAAADRSDITVDLDGALLVRSDNTLGDLLSERVSDTSGTSTAFTNFGATASTRNYIRAISVYNTSGTAGYVDFRDGTGGSILWTMPLPAGGGAVINADSPIFRTSANTALAYDVSAALTTVYISVSGFKSKV